jgi:HEAT repeat protein
MTLQQSGRWRQRAKAAAQLGKFHHRPAIAALADALASDSNDDVRLNAAWALGEMGRVDPAKPQEAAPLAPAVDALVKALGDKNWRVAEYAGAALGRIGDRRATAALLPRLNDKSKWVRRRTADALAEVGDPAAIGPIGERIGDPSREVRQAALNAMIRFCNMRIEPVNNLSNQKRDLETKQGKAEDIANVSQKRQAALDEFLAAYRLVADKASRDEFYVIRQVWIDALPRYQEAQDSVDVIVGALGDTNNAVREAALGALGQLGKQAEARQQSDAFRQRIAGTVPKVTGLLDDYYGNVRDRAVEVLASLAGKSVDEATGKSADYWKSRIPRPGDPRSPHAEYWKKAGG